MNSFSTGNVEFHKVTVVSVSSCRSAFNETPRKNIPTFKMLQTQPNLGRTKFICELNHWVIPRSIDAFFLSFLAHERQPCRLFRNTQNWTTFCSWYTTENHSPRFFVIFLKFFVSLAFQNTQELHYPFISSGVTVWASSRFFAKNQRFPLEICWDSVGIPAAKQCVFVEKTPFPLNFQKLVCNNYWSDSGKVGFVGKLVKRTFLFFQ